MGSNSFRVIKWRQEKAAKTKPNTGFSKHIPSFSLIVPSQRLLSFLFCKLYSPSENCLSKCFLFATNKTRGSWFRGMQVPLFWWVSTTWSLRGQTGESTQVSRNAWKRDRWTKMINNYPFGAYFKETGEFYSFCGKQEQSGPLFMWLSRKWVLGVC